MTPSVLKKRSVKIVTLIFLTWVEKGATLVPLTSKWILPMLSFSSKKIPFVLMQQFLFGGVTMQW